MIDTLLTVGYEGRDIAGFVDLLRQNGVELLVDVRQTPISRKPGFSKTALATAVGDGGIDYAHLSALGNPKEIREKARSVAECLRMYETHMADKWDQALEALLSRAEGHTACLLCFERDSAGCHRSIVADQLCQRIGGLQVVNL